MWAPKNAGLEPLEHIVDATAWEANVEALAMYSKLLLLRGASKTLNGSLKQLLDKHMNFFSSFFLKVKYFFPLLFLAYRAFHALFFMHENILLVSLFYYENFIWVFKHFFFFLVIQVSFIFADSCMHMIYFISTLLHCPLALPFRPSFTLLEGVSVCMFCSYIPPWYILLFKKPMMHRVKKRKMKPTNGTEEFTGEKMEISLS